MMCFPIGWDDEFQLCEDLCPETLIISDDKYLHTSPHQRGGSERISWGDLADTEVPFLRQQGGNFN